MGSQLGQDLWVLERLGGKRDGYFVEIGAGDGIYLSNTFLLESQYGWRGICAEPNRDFYFRLKANRACRCVDKAVHRESGKVAAFVPAGVYGTLEEYAGADHHAHLRKPALDKKYAVETISLDDLLDACDAPPTVDYISIDTEGGSEYDILAAFNFSRRVLAWTIEHNHTKSKELLIELMTARGYKFQIADFDLWFYL